MAKQVAEIVPGEVSQEAWDGKYDATTKALKDMGGADSKDQDDLPDGTTAKQFSTTEQTKLTDIEENAKDDQTGAEIQTSIKGLAWGDRDIVVSEPVSGENKVRGIHRNAAGNLEYDYEDVPEP